MRSCNVPYKPQGKCNNVDCGVEPTPCFRAVIYAQRWCEQEMILASAFQMKDSKIHALVLAESKSKQTTENMCLPLSLASRNNYFEESSPASTIYLPDEVLSLSLALSLDLGLIRQGQRLLRTSLWALSPSLRADRYTAWRCSLSCTRRPLSLQRKMKKLIISIRMAEKGPECSLGPHWKKKKGCKK